MTARTPGPRALDRSASPALWRQLHGDLARRIEAAEFPDTFPGELELMQSYQVSRHTVREAVGRLRREGVIQSSRGRSSVVAPGLIAQDLGAMYSLFHELEDRGIKQRSEVLVLDQRQDEQAAARLGLPPTTGVVYIERLRLADEIPLAWDCAWLEPELAAPLLEVDLTHTALYDEWHRVAGVILTGGEETIRAVVPSADLSTRLAMTPGEAALTIERTSSVGDRVAEFRRTLVRGSRFSFTARWSRSRAYAVDVVGSD